MKKAIIRHKSVNSEGFVEKYLSLQHHDDPYQHTIYDSSLVMQALQNTLQQTNQTLNQLKRHKINPQPCLSKIQTQSNQSQGLPRESFKTLTISQKSKKRNSSLLQILLKNVSNEKTLKGKYLQDGQDKGTNDRRLLTGGVTRREMTLLIDNSQKEEWKKDHIQKLMQARSLPQFQHQLQNPLDIKVKPATVHRNSHQGKLRRSQFPSLGERENEQYSSFLQVKDKKLSSIEVMRYPFPRTDPVGLNNHIDQKLHKHIFNRRQLPSFRFNSSLGGMDDRKGLRESLTIEPWGWGEKGGHEEMINSWQPTI